MKCGMCGAEYGNDPGACMSDADKLESTRRFDADNQILMLCRKCTPEFMFVIGPPNERMNSASCFYCGANCVGKYALCFELISSFTPMNAEEFRVVGKRIMFCKGCSVPISCRASTMCDDFGGTPPSWLDRFRPSTYF